MKVVISPDSYKECLTAIDAAKAMKKAILKVNPKAVTVLLPVGDGGEGTLEVLTYATNGKYYEKLVTGPLGEKVVAKYSILGDSKTAVVEMAEASGLHLIPKSKRNPMLTTSFGTGELIKAVLDCEIENLIVSVGGSGTNDCGVGMLQALGANIIDDQGKDIGPGGGALSEISKMEFNNLDPRLKETNILVASDVNNILTGPQGASEVFGPQKGATPDMVETMDKNIKRMAKIVLDSTGIDIETIPGSGAAGGLGAALKLCGGEITSGIDLVLSYIDFEDKIIGADYIFTGEGKIDSQTPNGKVISGIAKRGKQANIPVIAFAGSIESGYEPLLKKGLLSAHSITPSPMSLDEALINGEKNLIHAVENVTRLF